MKKSILIFSIFSTLVAFTNNTKETGEPCNLIKDDISSSNLQTSPPPTFELHALDFDTGAGINGVELNGQSCTTSNPPCTLPSGQLCTSCGGGKFILPDNTNKVKITATGYMPTTITFDEGINFLNSISVYLQKNKTGNNFAYGKVTNMGSPCGIEWFYNRKVTSQIDRCDDNDVDNGAYKLNIIPESDGYHIGYQITTGNPPNNKIVKLIVDGGDNTVKVDVAINDIGILNTGG